MSSLKELRQRIRSLKNTNKLTTAMKLVASSKLKRSLQDVQSARPYAGRLDALYRKMAQAKQSPTPFSLKRLPKKIRLCVVTSDRGLCGAFNHQLIKMAEEVITQFLKEQHQLQIIAIGNRGFDALIRRFPELPIESYSLSNHSTLELATEITHRSLREIEDNRLDALYITHNNYESILLQTAVTKQLFPPLPPDREEEQQCDSILEPNREKLLDVVIPQRLLSQLQLALLESVAGENGARMSAMENATRNSSELIDKLTTHANRIRQSAITTELTEIVSGAEALKN